MEILKIASLLLLLQGCSSNYEWGWYILSPDNIDGLTNLKFLISGITTTIYISVVSIILAMIIGLIIALPSLSNNKFLSYLNITYVEIVRAIPLLVLILWIYYGLPIMIGVSFSPFVSGIIALTISESAFQAAKKTLMSNHDLAHYDPKLPVKLAADASAYGIGAVISHQYPDGSECPISFALHTLTPSERNYAQLE